MQETNLRAAIEQVNEAIGRLGTHENSLISTQMTLLRASWADLVRIMDVEPALPTRECPGCGHTGLKVATRCGFCWVKLEPVVEPRQAA